MSNSKSGDVTLLLAVERDSMDLVRENEGIICRAMGNKLIKNRHTDWKQCKVTSNP